MNTRIALKYASAEEWERSKLSALQGEYLYDSTNHYIKVGDGTKTWNELQGIKISADSVDGLSNAVSSAISSLESKVNFIYNALSAAFAGQEYKDV